MRIWTFYFAIIIIWIGCSATPEKPTDQSDHQTIQQSESPVENANEELFGRLTQDLAI